MARKKYTKQEVSLRMKRAVKLLDSVWEDLSRMNDEQVLASKISNMSQKLGNYSSSLEKR